MTGSDGYALVTGGAGFIGSNLADRLLRDGHEVLLLDALARPGVEQNVAWLSARHGSRVRLLRGDVRDPDMVRRAVRGATQVFHLAAQVAVTTSLDDPMEDFEINAGGTLQVLEAIRARAQRPTLVYTSTNKVYGSLDDLALVLRNGRWEPGDGELARSGVDERRPLCFHSPYGCSKGAADQYVLDYAHTFEIPACVFRMSCIYGPRQFGTEDQGWLAHFLIAAHAGKSLALYGDGRQVRDALYVEDLVEAFVRARDNMGELRGQAFNLGGGAGSSTSLLELVERIATLVGYRPRLSFGSWRRADQRWYVTDTSRFAAATGWRPAVGLDEGLRRLDSWAALLAPPATSVVAAEH
jgi:CDP-paratose 2-epimerase